MRKWWNSMAILFQYKKCFVTEYSGEVQNIDKNVWMGQRMIPVRGFKWMKTLKTKHTPEELVCGWARGRQYQNYSMGVVSLASDSERSIWEAAMFHLCRITTNCWNISCCVTLTTQCTANPLLTDHPRFPTKPVSMPLFCWWCSSPTFLHEC